MKNLNKEDLLLELPDYIEGKLDEEEKVSQISFLINSDSEFRSEYEDLKDAISFSRNNEYSEPHDFYFNTLLTNIRERIDAVNSVKENSFFQKFKPAFFKFVMPVLIAGLILSAVYSLGVFDKNITEDELVGVTETVNDGVIEQEENIKEENEPIIIEETNLARETTAPVNIERTGSVNSTNQVSSVVTLSNGNSIQEYLDEVDNLSGLNYETMYDTEFTDLSSEEEDQIIESLNKLHL